MDDAVPGELDRVEAALRHNTIVLKGKSAGVAGNVHDRAARDVLVTSVLGVVEVDKLGNLRHGGRTELWMWRRERKEMRKEAQQNKRISCHWIRRRFPLLASLRKSKCFEGAL